MSTNEFRGTNYDLDDQSPRRVPADFHGITGTRKPPSAHPDPEPGAQPSYPSKVAATDAPKPRTGPYFPSTDGKRVENTTLGEAELDECWRGLREAAIGQLGPASANALRQEYRVLTELEKLQMRAIKEKGQHFLNILDHLEPSREVALARTNLEQAVMWAVKSVTK